jgi:formylmethanofuran dehydrogenase subunit B
MWGIILRVISSVACPVCGCVCDDIEISIEDGKIVRNKNGCVLSNAKFLNFNKEHRIQKPLVRKNQALVEVSFEEALNRAAKILVNANYPVLYGWSSTSCEAQRIGVELAEEVGGVFDNTSSVCHGPSTLGMQEVGIPSCTLGQVRHRADLIIYWGCDPLSSHPRHMQRYTSFAEGRFESSRQKTRQQSSENLEQEKQKSDQKNELENNSVQVQSNISCSNQFHKTLQKSSRKLIIIDVRKTLTASIADFFIQLEPNRDFELIQCLRVLVNDSELDVDSVAGIPVEYLKEVADALVNCEFGVIFFGMGLTQSAGKSRNIEGAIGLVRDLNAYTKFSIMPMRGHFNVVGSNIVSTWQTGYPFGVDFSLGYPRYNPGETSVVDILSRHETDAFLAVASDPVAGLPKSAVKNLLKIPVIVIDPHFNATSLEAEVVFPSAVVGIEFEGTAYRMDRVPLPLKKLIQAPDGILGDEEILERLLNKVKILKAQK